MLPAPMSEAPRRSDMLAAVQRSDADIGDVFACPALTAFPPGAPLAGRALPSEVPEVPDAAGDCAVPPVDCEPLPVSPAPVVTCVAADEGPDALPVPSWQAVSVSAATAISDPAATRRPWPKVLNVSDMGLPLVR